LCDFFHKLIRSPCSNQLSSTFGDRRVVFVASQRLRARVLLGADHDPLLALDLTPMQWVILERIGRARSQVSIMILKNIFAKKIGEKMAF
jgi:hypothetical protein